MPDPRRHAEQPSGSRERPVPNLLEVHAGTLVRVVTCRAGARQHDAARTQRASPRPACLGSRPASGSKAQLLPLNPHRVGSRECLQPTTMPGTTAYSPAVLSPSIRRAGPPRSSPSTARTDSTKRAWLGLLAGDGIHIGPCHAEAFATNFSVHLRVASRPKPRHVGVPCGTVACTCPNCSAELSRSRKPR